jgi:hypothetical protein
MKHITILIILISCVVFSYAQETDSEEDYSEESETYYDAEEETSHVLIPPNELPTTAGYKSEKITTKKFDDKKWKAIIGSTSYEEKKVDKPKQKPKQSKEETSSSPITLEGPALKIIFYSLVIAIILLLLFFILKNTALDLKLRRTQEQTNDLDKPVENIEEIDPLALLEKAKAEGNFRLAIRLYYLTILKNLNANGVIVWKKDKTNKEYLFELFLRNYYADEMKRITLSYEQVWYGEHILTAESFQKLLNHFEAMYQKLNAPK